MLKNKFNEIKEEISEKVNEKINEKIAEEEKETDKKFKPKLSVGMSNSKFIASAIKNFNVRKVNVTYWIIIAGLIRSIGAIFGVQNHAFYRIRSTELFWNLSILCVSLFQARQIINTSLHSIGRRNSSELYRRLRWPLAKYISLVVFFSFAIAFIRYHLSMSLVIHSVLDDTLFAACVALNAIMCAVVIRKVDISIAASILLTLLLWLFNFGSDSIWILIAEYILYGYTVLMITECNYSHAHSLQEVLQYGFRKEWKSFLVPCVMLIILVIAAPHGQTIDEIFGERIAMVAAANYEKEGIMVTEFQEGRYKRQLIPIGYSGHGSTYFVLNARFAELAKFTRNIGTERDLEFNMHYYGIVENFTFIPDKEK